jgi:hypothetical protein
MTWIKLDDKAHRHPKIDGLSDRAFRWWIRGLSYASEFLTDGELPYPFLRTVPRKVQDELRHGQLWKTDESGTVHIHDYLEHQTDRASVVRERERNRLRRGGTSGTTTGSTGGKPRPDTDTDTENREQRTESVNTHARRMAAGPLAGTLPRDFVDLGFNGTRLRVTVKTMTKLAGEWGEGGMVAVEGFLQTLNDSLGENQSPGDHLWLLKHWNAHLVAAGRIPPAPEAKANKPNWRDEYARRKGLAS